MAAYTEQLSEDVTLSQTEIAKAQSYAALGYKAASNLLAAYREPESPPADSLLVWVARATRIEPTQVVLGTVQSLLFTGDLDLIRDDKLRDYLPSHNETVTKIKTFIDGNTDEIFNHTRNLSRHVDFAEAFVKAERDSLGVIRLPRTGFRLFRSKLSRF